MSLHVAAAPRALAAAPRASAGATARACGTATAPPARCAASCRAAAACSVSLGATHACRRSARAPRGRAALLQVRADANTGAGAAGQITSALIKSMTDKISRALETDNVRVRDMQGDGRHVEIDVIAPAFEGKSAVERQRLVYKAIWVELQEAVHAVDAMTTRTPAEAGLA